MHRLLDFTGIEYDRLHVDWVSASEGKLFAEVVTNFTNQVKELGPIVISGNKEQIEEKFAEVSS